MKISVVHVCKVFLPVPGGIQTVIRRITGGLSDLLDTTVVSCSRDRVGETKTGPLCLLNTKSYGEWLSLPIAPSLIPTFRKKVRGSSLVCIHYPFPLAELALLFLNLHGKGLIVYWHSEIIAQKYARYLVSPLTQYMLRHADRVIVSSPRLLEYSKILRHYRSKCDVIPFGYDPGNDAPVPAVDGDYYVCVGRHVSYKGIDTLIRAWRDLDCKLVLVGSGQLLDSHEKLAEKLGVRENIEFVKNADDRRVRQYIAASRALILPSVAANEAFGLVQVEAMALGKPIINTNLDSGVPWVARDGLEAITVSPGSEQELHEAVQRLEHDSDLRVELARGALLRWQKEFNMDKFKQRTAALYQDVMDKTRT